MTLAGPRQHARWFYHVMALLTITMWSFSYLFIVWINEDLSPLGVSVGRHYVFSVWVVAILIWRRPSLRGITWPQWLLLIAFGLLGGIVYHSVFAWSAGQSPDGTDRIQTAVLGLIMATVPVHAAWLGWLFLNEKLTVRTIIALVLGLTGVVVVIVGKQAMKNGDAIEWFPRDQIEGPIAVVIASILAGGIVVFTRAGRRFLGAWDFIAISGIFMVLFSACLHPWAGFDQLPQMSAKGWLALLWLGLLGSGGAMITWAVALGGLQAVSAAMYLFMAAVLSAVWGWLFRDQAVGWPLFAGGALVLLGLIIQAGNGRTLPDTAPSAASHRVARPASAERRPRAS